MADTIKVADGGYLFNSYQEICGRYFTSVYRFR